MHRNQIRLSKLAKIALRVVEIAVMMTEMAVRAAKIALRALRIAPKLAKLAIIQAKIVHNLIKIPQLAIQIQTKPPQIPLITQIMQTTRKIRIQMKQMVPIMVLKTMISQIQRRVILPPSNYPPTAWRPSSTLVPPNRASRASRVRRAAT